MTLSLFQITNVRLRFWSQACWIKESNQNSGLAAMLGVTAGRGNTVDEVISCLDRAASADGTRPSGTIYLMTNGDVRTTTRSSVCASVTPCFARFLSHKRWNSSL
jgi:hypothetical protein